MIYKIFRFDKNTDYEGYYKPYVYEQDFESFLKLFEQIQSDDIYFRYDKDPNAHIVVNGLFVKGYRPLSDFVADELIIEPLDTKRSVKDLIIEKSDFYSHLADFKTLIDENDEELYKQYDFLYYQSEMREFYPEYKGDSYLIFIHNMLFKYKEKTQDFLKLAASEIPYHTTFRNTLFYNVKEYKENIRALKRLLFEAKLLEEGAYV